MRIRDSVPANVVRWAINFRGQRPEIPRRYLFAALSRFTPALAVDTEGLRLHLSTADRGVSLATFAAGAYELPLLARVQEELARRGSPGLHARGFLDIGANIGTATCLAIARFGASRAWAFEPAPENLRLLRQNLLANGLEDRVSIHACALTDHDGVVEFGLSDTNWGDHRVQPATGRDREGRATLAVPAVRLDALTADRTVDLEAAGLAWIDVQGHEGHVLAGARSLLRSQVPIVCEYWPGALREAEGLERFHELVATERAAFIDLGRPGSTARPTGELGALAREYESRRRRLTAAPSTDLLLLA
ncbi:MAG TPA: FkbM family methyltransferase [Baekduia sp.]|nr:FkbM family methyltransferase [Baekduia sp.]